MKIKPLVLLLSAVFLGSGAAWAQTPNMTSGPATPAAATAAPAPSAPSDRPPDGGMHHHGWADNMPPEMRKQFDAAREKALQDPTIQDLRKKADAANHELFDAMRAKMEEIDPSLVDLIKKQAAMMAAHQNKKDTPDGEGNPLSSTPGANHSHAGSGSFGGSGAPGSDGMASLTDDERQKLLVARQKLKDDATVETTRLAIKTATTPDERRDAEQRYRQAMHDALIKSDPTLEPILKKLNSAPGTPLPPSAAAAPSASPAKGADMMNSQ